MVLKSSWIFKCKVCRNFRKRLCSRYGVQWQEWYTKMAAMPCGSKPRPQTSKSMKSLFPMLRCMPTTQTRQVCNILTFKVSVRSEMVPLTHGVFVCVCLCHCVYITSSNYLKNQYIFFLEWILTGWLFGWLVILAGWFFGCQVRLACCFLGWLVLPGKIGWLVLWLPGKIGWMVL